MGCLGFILLAIGFFMLFGFDLGVIVGISLLLIGWLLLTLSDGDNDGY